MKRFYKLVSTRAEKDGWAVFLDGKPVRTPARALLLAPNENLALALAAEWAAQIEDVNPETMPLMQLMVTAQDRVSTERTGMERAVLAYLDTDLLCYRTETPALMGERQAKLWDPWLSWFEKEFGASLQTTAELRALKQTSAVHEAVTRAVQGLDDLRFTVLQSVVAASGSLVLALAFAKGAITPDALVAAVNAEEDLKGEICGEDEHGAAPLTVQRKQSLRLDLEAARVFLDRL